MRSGGAACVLVSALLLGGCAGSPFHAQRSAFDRVSPPDLMTLQESAQTAYAEGNAPAATALYTQMVQRVPGDAQAWRRLGNLELLDGQYARSLFAYEHALQTGGGNATVWHNIAMIRVRQAQQALAQAQSQPDARQSAIGADSKRAAQVLDGVFPRSAPAPAASTAAAAPERQP